MIRHDITTIIITIVLVLLQYYYYYSITTTIVLLLLLYCTSDGTIATTTVVVIHTYIPYYMHVQFVYMYLYIISYQPQSVLSRQLLHAATAATLCLRFAVKRPSCLFNCLLVPFLPSLFLLLFRGITPSLILLIMLYTVHNYHSLTHSSAVLLLPTIHPPLNQSINYTLTITQQLIFLFILLLTTSHSIPTFFSHI